MSKGNVGEMPDYAMRDPSNLFLGQPDGTFVEGAEAAGIVSFDKGRGAALADFNQDGLLDLVEVEPRRAGARCGATSGPGTADAPAPMGNWLGAPAAPAGRQPRRDRRGRSRRRSAMPIQRREVIVGGGHIGGQLGWQHVGLGPATEAQVRVTWPDGEVGPVADGRGRTSSSTSRAARPRPTPWTPPGS